MQTRSITTKQRILEAAALAFGKNGYDATSVSDICAIVDISKGAFYHHFPTKHDVFLTLLNQWLEKIDVQMALIVQNSQSVPESLVNLTNIIPGIFSDADNQLGMFLEFWTQANRDPSVWKMTIAPYEKYTDFFVQLIQKGMDEGSIAPGDATVIAKIIVSLAFGILMQGMLDTDPAAWRNVALEAMKMVVHK